MGRRKGIPLLQKQKTEELILNDFNNIIICFIIKNGRRNGKLFLVQVLAFRRNIVPFQYHQPARKA